MPFLFVCFASGTPYEGIRAFSLVAKQPQTRPEAVRSCGTVSENAVHNNFACELLFFQNTSPFLIGSNPTANSA